MTSTASQILLVFEFADWLKKNDTLNLTSKPTSDQINKYLVTTRLLRFEAERILNFCLEKLDSVWIGLAFHTSMSN